MEFLTEHDSELENPTYSIDVISVYVEDGDTSGLGDIGTILSGSGILTTELGPTGN